MGNYVFDADVLIDAVTADSTLEGSKHDMGGDIVPALVEEGAAYTYDFKNNVIPGGTERDMGYWRDVGTMDSYFDAHMDLVSIHPVFNLYNYDWPIYTTLRPVPARQVRARPPRPVRRGAQLGGLPRRRHLRRADQRLGRLPRRARAQLHRGRHQRHPRRRADRAELPHPAGRSSTRTSSIPEATSIGFDREHDEARGFSVTESGITVVGKGQVVVP